MDGQERNGITVARPGNVSCALAIVAGLLIGLYGALPAAAQTKRAPVPQPAPQVLPQKPKIIPGGDPGGVAVAIIGTGVNYTLPAIANRLARDGEGDIIGLDMLDGDNRPFERDPVIYRDWGAGIIGGPATGVRPWGTTLVSVLLAKAPRARLVPVRLPHQSPQLGGAVAFVAATPARVALLGLPDGAGYEGIVLQQVGTLAPQVLFVIAAGDHGLNLDEKPPWPSGLGFANAIVVTALNAEGRMLPKANTGTKTIDVAVLAENVAGLTFEGVPVQVAGTTYAAAQIAALAARLLEANPKLTTTELKALVLAAAAPVPPDTKTGIAGLPTRFGAIANPDAVTYKAKP